jgi:RNA polymerase sigma-70 factor (ECF subfamily)
MLGNRELADDVVQTALVDVYRTIDTFRGECSIKTWLFRAVHHRAIDELRRRKRFVEVGSEDLEAGYFDGEGRWARSCPGRMDAELHAKRMVERVREAIDELPHGHREVLLLREVHGLDAAEICETLEISPANLRTRLHRARKALRIAVYGNTEEAA